MESVLGFRLSSELQTRTASFHLLGLGRYLGPLLLAVNNSYFALFSLIT